MTPQEAKRLFDFLHQWAVHEGKTTRKVLAAVPNSNLEYCPDPKCMKALELAGHIAGADYMFIDSIAKGSFQNHETTTFENPDAVVKFYDETVLPALDGLASLTPEQLAEPLTMFVWTLPRVTFLQWLIVHSVHHRGQLSAYLRPMGAKVPSIYGGSADEPFVPEQAANA